MKIEKMGKFHEISMITRIYVLMKYHSYIFWEIIFAVSCTAILNPEQNPICLDGKKITSMKMWETNDLVHSNSYFSGGVQIGVG